MIKQKPGVFSPDCNSKKSCVIQEMVNLVSPEYSFFVQNI